MTVKAAIEKLVINENNSANLLNKQLSLIKLMNKMFTQIFQISKKS